MLGRESKGKRQLSVYQSDRGLREPQSRIEKDGSISTLADRHEGKRFNSPNDAVCRPNSDINFTDRNSAARNHPADPNADFKPELGFNGVYRVTAAGARTNDQGCFLP